MHSVDQYKDLWQNILPQALSLGILALWWRAWILELDRLQASPLTLNLGKSLTSSVLQFPHLHWRRWYWTHRIVLKKSNETIHVKAWGTWQEWAVAQEILEILATGHLSAWTSQQEAERSSKFGSPILPRRLPTVAGRFFHKQWEVNESHFLLSYCSRQCVHLEIDTLGDTQENSKSSISSNVYDPQTWANCHLTWFALLVKHGSSSMEVKSPPSAVMCSQSAGSDLDACQVFFHFYDGLTWPNCSLFKRMNSASRPNMSLSKSTE